MVNDGFAGLFAFSAPAGECGGGEWLSPTQSPRPRLRRPGSQECSAAGALSSLEEQGEAGARTTDSWSGLWHRRRPWLGEGRPWRWARCSGKEAQARRRVTLWEVWGCWDDTKVCERIPWEDTCGGTFPKAAAPLSDSILLRDTRRDGLPRLRAGRSTSSAQHSSSGSAAAAGPGLRRDAGLRVLAWCCPGGGRTEGQRAGRPHLFPSPLPACSGTACVCAQHQL